jgi:hypothetical protein
MKTMRLRVYVFSCVFALPLPAKAADVLLDGEAACYSLRGEWQYGGSCTLGRLVVPAGTRLVTGSSVTLTTGVVINDGTIETNGTFRPNGTLINRGTLVTNGMTVNAAPLYNRGTWFNHGWLHPHSLVVNEWNFEQNGYFETCTGWFVNRGYMRNSSALENWGGLVVNEGLAVNDGYVYNPSDGYRLENGGALENNGTIVNEGVALGKCGGAWYGSGDYSGNPIEFEPCLAADAVDVLANVVLGLNPAGVLSRDDTLLLSSLLFKAGKRLEEEQSSEAAILLDRFRAEVLRLMSEGLAPVIGRSLVARADRALELVVQPE